MLDEQTLIDCLRENQPILLAGPTASGKSALASLLAQRLDGIIVNADSMQIYTDLRLLTARPSESEERLAPHYLYGHVEGGEAYSVGRWLDDVAGVLRAHAHRRVIVVGGTGLYFDALTKGIARIPAVPDAVRAYWRERGQHTAVADLHAELVQRDPEMAEKLRPTDPQRIIRALEVFDATGKSLLFWQTQMSDPLLPEGHFTGLVLAPERAWLRERIARRFHAMVEQGAVEEVKGLMQRGLASDLPVMKSLGVPPLIAFITGEMGREEAIAQSILDTSRYAKRQDTWFRNRMKSWFFIQNPQTAIEKCENL